MLKTPKTLSTLHNINMEVKNLKIKKGKSAGNLLGLNLLGLLRDYTPELSVVNQTLVNLLI
jgi:hypothetical protein